MDPFCAAGLLAASYDSMTFKIEFLRPGKATAFASLARGRGQLATEFVRAAEIAIYLEDRASSVLQMCEQHFLPMWRAGSHLLLCMRKLALAALE